MNTSPIPSAVPSKKTDFNPETFATQVQKKWKVISRTSESIILEPKQSADFPNGHEALLNRLNKLGYDNFRISLHGEHQFEVYKIESNKEKVIEKMGKLEKEITTLKEEIQKNVRDFQNVTAKLAEESEKGNSGEARKLLDQAKKLSEIIDGKTNRFNNLIIEYKRHEFTLNVNLGGFKDKARAELDEEF